ncbi:hypothetical protein BOQ63_000385 (plasmid) [Streptomyces viridifaciens]|nr:hypothetical protein BOQ63_000385 [Streptomyces viridifaciens]
MPQHRRPLFTPRYTATALLNTATGPHGWPDHHFGYRPGHPLLQAADPDLLTRPLTFTLEAPSLTDAVQAARSIGQRATTDLHRTGWPRRLRRLYTGDVIALTPANTPREPRYYALGPDATATALPRITPALPLAWAIQNPAISARLVHAQTLTADQTT